MSAQESCTCPNMCTGSQSQAKTTSIPLHLATPFAQRQILPCVCTVYKLGVHDWDSFLVCTAGECVYTVSCAVKDYNRRTSSYSKSYCLAIHQVREGLWQFHSLEIGTPTIVLCSLPTCPRMQESTPPERTRSALVAGFSLVPLLLKEGECGELVLPSLPPLVRRTEESEELVCGRVRDLTGNRKNNSVPAVSVWSEEEEQGGGRGSLLVNVEDSICTEPHLEVDTEEEPKTVPIQESRQT